MEKDKVKQKIQELCPDVMELKKGCKTSRGEISAIFESQGYYRYGIVNGAQWPGSFSGYLYEKEALREILGSPITLAVVLRAIEKVSDNSKGYTLSVVSDGCFYNPTKDEMICENRNPKTIDDSIRICWNLLHDNYDLQSEEVKQFIGEILNVAPQKEQIK